jgi:hypothetical protein
MLFLVYFKVNLLIKLTASVFLGDLFFIFDIYKNIWEYQKSASKTQYLPKGKIYSLKNLLLGPALKTLGQCYYLIYKISQESIQILKDITVHLL